MKNNLILLIGSVLAISVILIFSRRMYVLSPEVKSPVSYTLMVLSGVYSTIFLAGSYFQYPQISSFTPGRALLLLFYGILFKILMIEKVLGQLLIYLNNGLLYLIDWSTNRWINLTRVLLVFVSMVLLIIPGIVEPYLSIPRVMAFALLSITVILSSLSEWNGRYVVIRLTIFFLSIIFLFSEINLPTNEEVLAARVFIASFWIWIFSIPSIITFFSVRVRGLISFVKKYLIPILRITSFIAAWFALFMLDNPLNYVSFIVLMLFWAHPWLADAMNSLYHATVNFIVNIYKFVLYNRIKILRGIGVIAAITSLFVLEFPINILSFTILIFLSLYPWIISFSNWIYVMINRYPVIIARIIIGAAGVVLIILHFSYPDLYLNYLGFLLIVVSLYSQILSFTTGLLDYLNYVLNQFKSSIIILFSWIRLNKWLSMRLISGVFAFASFIAYLGVGDILYLYSSIGLLLIALSTTIWNLSIVIGLKLKQFYHRTISALSRLYAWIAANKFLTIRLFFGITSGILLIIYWITDYAYLLWAALFSILFSISPSIYNFSLNLYEYISSKPKQALQIGSTLLAFVSLWTLPEEPILNTRLDILFFWIFILVALSPWIYSILNYILPGISRFITRILRNFKAVDRITAIVATAFLFIPRFITLSNVPIIGLYVIIALLYTVSFNFAIMRFIDSIVSMIYLVIYGLIKFVSNLTKFLYNIGFLDFLKRLVISIFNSIYRFIRYLYQNLIIVLLYGIAFGFMLFGIGVLFPGIFPPSAILRDNLQDNFLISLLVAGFLVALGGLTFKEVFARRENLRLEVK